LSGAPVAESILGGVASRVTRLLAQGVVPTLATILVGDDTASQGYVQKKHEACAALGMRSIDARLPASAAAEELHALIARLNADASVHGVLVQSPLPASLDFNAALLQLAPHKDADGLHPENLGRLVVGMPGPLPATPAGIHAMFQHYGVEVAGRHVVIVGRGPTLGRPLSLLLSSKRIGANAAVTLVHSRVPGWQRFTREADIVVMGVGRAGLLQPDAVKPGAVVVSAGITWQGKKLLPDVDESVAEVASWITPRLGGVGATTLAMLLANTVLLTELAVGSLAETSLPDTHAAPSRGASA
jgi:methylenetetrahydrofolate dehydrogenase (NADP+)/methenyltetrahydrofolate cyclohydrolase